MSKRTYEKPLHIDMSFDEALRRFAQTDSAEIPENKKLRRKAGRNKRPTRKPIAGRDGGK